MAFNPNTLHREEYLKKKRKRRIIRYSIATALVFMIVGLSSYISRRPNFRIGEIVLSGGVLVTKTDVTLEALTLMDGFYFWLFPKNNVLWYPHDRLEEHLKNKFKRIDAIDIRLKDFRTLVVTITERKPVATWCDNPPVRGLIMEDGSSMEQCYFLDQNSTIFASAPYFSGDAYFKYYGLITDDNPIGLQYLSSSTLFSGISDFVEKTKKLSIRPLYIIAKGDGEFSLIVSGGGEIYFDTKEPLPKVFSNLESLLHTPELSIGASRNLPVEYIDLRYGNKLFYKLKE